jgi:hypothetical protein
MTSLGISDRAFYMRCNENPIYVVLLWELRGLSLNFHIHVNVSDLYIPRIGPHIFCSRIGSGIIQYKSLTDTWMWKLGSEAAQFLKYITSTFGTVCKANPIGCYYVWRRGCRRGNVIISRERRRGRRSNSPAPFLVTGAN